MSWVRPPLLLGRNPGGYMQRPPSSKPCRKDLESERLGHGLASQTSKGAFPLPLQNWNNGFVLIRKVCELKYCLPYQ